MKLRPRFFCLPCLLLAFLLCLPHRGAATHIAGADLYYELIDCNTHTYKVTLKLYRDCFYANPQATYEDIELFIFSGATGALVQNLIVPQPLNTPQIQPTSWANCTATPPNDVCVQEGIYTTTLVLPPIPGGYNIAWARCCRNSVISNLAQPLAEGVTFLAHVPDTALAQCNSMPIFKQRPPIFLCKDQLFSFDHSATDADGDSLVYALRRPFTGTNLSGLGAGNNTLGTGAPPPVVGNILVNPANPMGPPPYANVAFGAGYTFTDPFGTGNFTIDPQTGFINVTPNQVGIFVLAISVFEYRNGVLLSENKRDIQIHVLQCLAPVPPPVITHNLSGLTHVGDTIIANAKQQFCYPFTVTSPNTSTVLQSFTVSNAFSKGAQMNTSGTNPVNGQICWTPACNYVGQTIQLIIGAKDANACQNIAQVFDTVWVKIIAPQPSVTIQANFAGLTHNGDTIIVNNTNTVCFPFTASSPNGGVSASPNSPIFSAGATMTVLNGNPLTGTVCWKPSCQYAGQKVPFIIAATDAGACPGYSAQDYDTVWIRFIPPPNNPPAVTVNLAGNITKGDTIIIKAGQKPCFSFTSTDPDTGTVLQSIFTTAPPQGMTVTNTGTNPLVTNVCWQSDCANVGQTFVFTLQTSDAGQCSTPLSASKAMFVRILPPTNTPPVVTRSFAGLNANGDTLRVLPDRPFCFSYTLTDADAGDSLMVQPIVGFSGTNPAAITTSGKNPLTVNICWKPDCNLNNATMPIVLAFKDRGFCGISAIQYDTVWVRILIPPNVAPVITTNLAGLTTSNDTIFVNALDSICYTFQVTDADAKDTLALNNFSSIFSAAAGVSLSFSGINPIIGQICWKPACSFIGQIIPFSFKASDNIPCGLAKSATKTLWIKINMPPNQPPVISLNLAGNKVIGDTLFVPADTSFCFDVVMSDADAWQTLAYTFQTGLDTAALPPTFLSFGTNPVSGTVCWKADCKYEGLIFPIVFRVIDNALCNNSISVSDTVWVKIPKPASIPPKVTLDFSNTPFNAQGMISGQLGVPVCFGFQIVDFTPESGVKYKYEVFDIWGKKVGLGKLSATPNAAGDTITGKVCYTPDCSQGGSTYRIRITAYDVKYCPPFDSTFAETKIKIDIPQFTAYAGPDVFHCEGTGGSQLQVQATGGQPTYTYQWWCNDMPNCGFSNPHAPNPVMNPSKDSVTAFVQITDTAGCTSEIDSIVIFIRPLPLVVVPQDTFICEGGAGVMLGYQILNAAPNQAPGPYKVLWSPATGLNDPTLSTPYAQPTITTIYKVSVTSLQTGCSNDNLNLSDSTSVTVEVRARPKATAGNDFSICLGDTAQLQGTPSGAGPAYQYGWTPGSTGYMSDSTAMQPLVSPNFTTTYFFTVTSNTCPSIQDSVVVYVNSIPSGGGVNYYGICLKDSAQLSIVAAGSPIDTFAYHWLPGIGLNDSTIKNPKASPPTTTVYSVFITTQAGCKSNEIPVIVEILPTPIVTLLGDTTICSGDSVSLLGSYVSSNGLKLLPPIEYSWNPTKTLTDTTDVFAIAKPTATTRYTLTVTSEGCSGSDDAIVFVQKGIIPKVWADTTILCSGDSVRVHASGGAGSANIQWQPSAWVLAPNDSVSLAFPDTTVTLIADFQEGICRARDSVRISVNRTPELGMSIGQIPCDTTAIICYASAKYGFSYIWDFGSNFPIQNNEQFVLPVAGTGAYPFHLTVLGAGGCAADTSGIVNVIAPPAADFVSIPPRDSILYPPDAVYQFQPLAAGGKGVLQYRWLFGDSATSHLPKPSHEYLSGGTYPVTLIVRDSAGCETTVTYPYTVGIPNLFIPNLFTPNGDGINDVWQVKYEGSQPFYTEVFDRWGRRMYVSNDPKATWDGTATGGVPASAGVYYYMVRIAETNVFKGSLSLFR